MKKIAFRGDRKEGNKIKETLIKLGGKCDIVKDCNDERKIYFLNDDNIIISYLYPGGGAYITNYIEKNLEISYIGYYSEADQWKIGEHVKIYDKHEEGEIIDKSYDNGIIMFRIKKNRIDNEINIGDFHITFIFVSSKENDNENVKTYNYKKLKRIKQITFNKKNFDDFMKSKEHYVAELSLTSNEL